MPHWHGYISAENLDRIGPSIITAVINLPHKKASYELTR